MNTFHLLIQFGQVQTELANLLNVRFTSNTLDTQIEEYVYSTQLNIIKAINEGDLARAQFNHLKLKIFTKHLSEIEENDPELFKDFVSELKRVEYDTYFGTRFEVDIAASLIRSGIQFTHPDPPDFVIQRGSKEVKLECTTSHVSGKNIDLERKIKDAVSSKSNKDYYGPSTALLIDITNLIHIGFKEGQEPTADKFRQFINEREDVFDLDIGSVILFSYHIEEAENGYRIKHSYIREDNHLAKDHLINLLNELWPFKSVSGDEYFYPDTP